MIGILLLTHGGLANELEKAARTIAGPHPNMGAVSLDWSESRDAARDRVAAALADLDRGSGILVLTDLAGGTPSNIAMEFRRPGKVEVVSGVNLPMVVRLSCLGRNGTGLEQMSEWIREKGRDSICRPPSGRSPDPCDETEGGIG